MYFVFLERLLIINNENNMKTENFDAGGWKLVRNAPITIELLCFQPTRQHEYLGLTKVVGSRWACGNVFGINIIIIINLFSNSISLKSFIQKMNVRIDELILFNIYVFNLLNCLLFN